MDMNKKLLGEVRSLRKEVCELNHDIKNVIALLFDEIDDNDMEDDNMGAGSLGERAEDVLYRLEHVCWI